MQRPEPKGELEHVNAYTLLVAVVLSAQATDAGVNKATRPLFKIADTPEKMLELGEEKLGGYIRTIGLWRAKAKNVMALSEALIRDHDGEVPGDRDALVTLPGVGRKTANVVLNMAFGQPTMAVDTHIFRLGNRLRPGAWQDAGRGRAGADQHHSRQIHAPCASLADPARTLCLQGAGAGMLALHHCRSLQGGGEDQQYPGAAGGDRRGNCSDAVAARHGRRKDRDQDEDRAFGPQPGAHRADFAFRHDMAGVSAQAPVPFQDAGGRQAGNCAAVRNAAIFAQNTQL